MDFLTSPVYQIAPVFSRGKLKGLCELQENTSKSTKSLDAILMSNDANEMFLCTSNKPLLSSN
jgi:hypothetical protein